jgi:hypothetical protein
MARASSHACRAVPRRIDQPGQRYYAVGVEQERREDPPVTGAAELQHATVVAHLQRPQDPELHSGQPRLRP